MRKPKASATKPPQPGASASADPSASASGGPQAGTDDATTKSDVLFPIKTSAPKPASS